MKTDFKNGDDVDARLRELRSERDHALHVVAEHARALKDPMMRGTLLKDAVYDALSTTAPFRYVASFFERWNK